MASACVRASEDAVCKGNRGSDRRQTCLRLNTGQTDRCCSRGPSTTMMRGMQISEALEGQAEEVGLAAGQRGLSAPGSQISRPLKCDSHRASPQEKGILCPKSEVSGLLKTLLVSKQGLVKWRRAFGRQATGTGSINE